MLRHVRHRSNGLARILLAGVLILSGVAFSYFEAPANTDPRMLRVDNHRLAGCSRDQRESFAARLACGDPLDKRRPASASNTVRVRN